MGSTTSSRVRSVIVFAALLAVGFGLSRVFDHVFGVGLVAPEIATARADRDLVVAWFARVLLVLTIAWIVIGMLSARTRLVRRPGAAAARASWISATHPWRAVESMLGMLPADRVLLVSVPAALLVATRAVQTSLLSWTHLALALGAWVVFLAVVLLIARRRSPWPVIATVGGVIVLRCAVALAALSLSGPEGYWSAVWTEPVLRAIYITVAFAGFAWMFVAAGWTLSLRWGRRRAAGIVLAGGGAALAVPAAIVAAVGPDTLLTLGSVELAQLPWGLARVVGIAADLDIPVSVAVYAAGIGVALGVLGALLAIRWRRG